MAGFHFVTDLDGTWLPLPEQGHDLRRLETALLARPEVVLTFATGRTFSSAREAIARWNLVPPHHLISDVGTALFHRVPGGGWVEDEAWAGQVQAVWEPEAADRLMARLPASVRPQAGVAPIRRLALRRADGEGGEGMDRAGRDLAETCRTARFQPPSCGGSAARTFPALEASIGCSAPWNCWRVPMSVDLVVVERQVSDLIIASHRGPYVHHPGEGWRRRVNGVFGAMEPVMRSTGGTWVCWGLREEEEAASERHRAVLVDDEDRFRMHEVMLRPQEAKEFYEGFTTEALWPILFCFPSRLQFTQGLWDTYRMVNERFAQAIARQAARGATVWIQDFHLMLLPALLRKLRPDLKLGFFLHTAFPPPDVFGILPWRETLLEGVLGCDLVGFHIPLYATNFALCCGRFLGSTPHWIEGDQERHVLAPSLTCDSLVHGGRTVHILALGIGASREDIERLAADPAAQAYAANLKSQMGVEHLLLSAERLDYVKGPVERVKAMEALFDLHPEWIGRVTLLQVAVPSREGVAEFERLKNQTHRAVGELNSRLGSPTWQPIVNLGKTLPLEELVGLYMAADVCLVTPLRDGMNLVAKEYVLCREDGSVVLSEFAGAAFDLPGAMLVNPFSPEHVAEGIHGALKMPGRERKRRFISMRRVCRKRDLTWWRMEFLRHLGLA